MIDNYKLMMISSLSLLSLSNWATEPSGLKSWFQNQEQQAATAFAQQKYENAAQLFSDP
jgi:hypothetical protein